MKRVLGVGLLVFVVPVLQGALAPFLPSPLRPDLWLLVVFSLVLCWRNSATGMLVAAASGFVMDLFSGALLGQHALLAVLLFATARVLAVQVSLAGPVPQMLFAGALTALHALGLAALTAFFTPEAGLGVLRPAQLGPHVLVNACLAPLVVAVVSAGVGWISGDDVGRRTLRFESRHWAA